ncbi:hypothetical protein [Candidatus Lokiarchaeum ossiferum]|uniref:hypothetical protein n=1 Tax=Candidatus Lokiarchaeum ossiferum TaxID=2951803 RepID=UPI00352E0EF8
MSEKSNGSNYNFLFLIIFALIALMMVNMEKDFFFFLGILIFGIDLCLIIIYLIMNWDSITKSAKYGDKED